MKNLLYKLFPPSLGQIKSRAFIPDAEIYLDLSLKKMESPVARQDLEIIGHQVGSYLDYPINLKNARQHKNIKDLMDTAFEQNKLSGIEIDVRLRPDNVVCVVHDEIPRQLDQVAKDYTDKNTLEGVLRHLLKNKNYSDKTLYIEIKCNHAKYISSHERLTMDKTCEVVEAVRTNLKLEPARITRQIKFVSFNMHSLEYLQKNKFGFEFENFYIASSNRGLLKVAQATTGNLLKDYEFLGPLEKDQLAKSAYLTGIWFDPAGITKFGEVFNEINDKRTGGTEPKKPLKICVSTYKLTREQFLKRLDDQGKSQLRHVSGFVFNIDSRNG